MKNRIVMAPITTNYATSQGAVTPAMVEYYRTRARGGVGLIIVEATSVDSTAGRGGAQEMVADDDGLIPGLTELAAAIKGAGAGAALQLNHAGISANPKANSLPPVAPSAVSRRGYPPAREMTVAEIRQAVACFAAAARRAKKAGFDGVEVHSAHLYLGAQFLSAGWNHRQDEYGGPVESRARFLREVVAAIKEAVGSSYPVWCRINSSEPGLEGGITLKESQEIARRLEAVGADAVHLSAFGYGAHPTVGVSDNPGALLPHIASIKGQVKVPVMAISWFDPSTAERALREGSLDLVVMGRRLLADPELPLKLLQGKAEEVVPCIACNVCLDTQGQGRPVQCAVNPSCGREGELRIERTAAPRRVLVVGGGPAGLTAARVAAQRGHRVSLYEKEPSLGGQLPLAVVPPGKERLRPLLDYLTRAVKEAGVEVVVSKEVSQETVRQLRSEAVILTTGALPLIPSLAGLQGGGTVLAEEVLAGKAQVGQRVAVLGGGLVAGEVADFLAARSRQVTIITREERLAPKMVRLGRRVLLDHLAAGKVNIITGVKERAIEPGGVLVTLQDGKQEHIPADTVVLALGARADNSLAGQLEGATCPVYAAGDCVEPRGFLEAIHEGFLAALKV